MAQKTISKNGLSIILDDEMIPRVKEEAVERASDIDSGIDTWYNVTGCEYIDEVDRLCKIAESIVSSTNKIDIFDYLPLTKAGKFPKNKTILIADSDVKNTFNSEYFSQKTLQLRLVPGYANDLDFIHNKPVSNTLLLEIDEFNSSSKTPPVFDKAGTLNKVIKTRSSYLKNDEILPGHTYIDDKGTEYLYLGFFDFYRQLKISDISTKREIDGIYPSHIYVKVTKSVLELAKACSTMNNFIDMAVIEWSNHKSAWYEKLSIRANPRKFVKEHNILISDGTITSHIAETADFTMGPYSRCRWQYEIVATK